MKMCISVYTLEVRAIGSNLNFDQIYALSGVNYLSPEIVLVTNLCHSYCMPRDNSTTMQIKAG